jgi:hypothetical protein
MKIREHPDESAGLKSSIADVVAQAYGTARVAVSTRFSLTAEPPLPNYHPWTFEQMMNEQFWPE